MMIYWQFLNVVLITLNAINYTEENEVPAAEMIMATYQFTQCDGKKTELVIGKLISLPNEYSNSELVIGYN